MIEIITNTGEYFSGESYHQDGSVFSQIGSIDSTDVMALEIGANGKILHETQPIVTISGVKTFYNNTGEIFLSGFELKNSTGEPYVLPVATNLTYDWISNSGRYFYEDNVHLELISGFSGVASLTNNEQVFLNGQKLVHGSGESFFLQADGTWEWTDPENAITGILFSMSYRPHVYHSGVYDIIGEVYNRNGFVAYLNGIRLTDDEFVQIGDVVVNIETGLEPCVELNFPQNEKVFFM